MPTTVDKQKGEAASQQVKALATKMNIGEPNLIAEIHDYFLN